MAFKALAQITVNPDGTITGEVIEHELTGISLVENGVYELGFETFHSKLGLMYVGKVEGVADES
ncbi:hypothetical protein POP15_060 [Pectobacterium phage POP15]|nr:hypothetical protein POP15_060 [Pectobacterium phage POP15]